MKKLLILALPLILSLFIGWSDWGGGGTGVSEWNRDSMDIYWSDSIPNAHAAAKDSADVAVTSLKGSAQTITGVWNFDANCGVIDGNKFFITDGDEDDTLFMQIVNDSVKIWTSGIPLVMGDEGKTLTDSLEIGGGETIIKWDQVGGQLAIIANDLDTFYVPLDSTGGGSGADDWVYLSSIPEWGGGTSTNNSTSCFYMSATTGDSLWSLPFSVKIEDDGSAIVVDSIMFEYRTQGNEDSLKVVLQYLSDCGNTVTSIDSAWFGGGTSGYAEGNVLTNGDLTVTKGTHDAFRFKVGCVNDGNNDIRVPYCIRIVCHK